MLKVSDEIGHQILTEVYIRYTAIVGDLEALGAVFDLEWHIFGKLYVVVSIGKALEVTLLLKRVMLSLRDPIRDFGQSRPSVSPHCFAESG
jgi:hypothetical protein